MTTAITRITVRLPVALEKQCKKAAASERRNLSDWVRLRLEEAISNPNQLHINTAAATAGRKEK